MSNKLGIWGFVLLLLFMIMVASPSYCKKKSEKISPERKIHMFMLAMDSGIIEKKALSELKKLTRSKDPSIKSRAIGLLAQYEGEGTGNLIKALTILIPYVLDKKEADSFKRKLIAGKDDKEFLSAIPQANKWKFQEPELCVSMARILAFGGKYSEALAGFDRVGKNKEGVPRIMAAEGIGDMQFALKRWEQCIGSYQFALKSVNYLKKLYKYEEAAPDPIINALSQRIQRKLNEARKKWDEERYGPGYVAYRDARRKQFGKQFASATIAYKRITEKFSDTVYSEAAGLYGPQCLFKLAIPGKKESMEKTLTGLKDSIAKNKKKLQKYGKMMTIPVRERLRTRIENDEDYYKELKLVPTGRKAEEKAIADLEEFIKQPEKIYRLEAMQTLGDYFLEEKLDVESAYKYYGQCYKALEQISELNSKLQSASAESWSVPSKASSISRPPRAEKRLVGWTQWIEKTPIKPEQIINRQHCDWYLDSIKARTGKMLSLCFFIRGDKEQALEAAKFIIKYEPLERMMYNKKQPNSYDRLLFGYNRGWMRASKEELDLFKEKLRTAVILGDFYYEVEDETNCLKIRTRLVNAEYGKLTKNQEATGKYLLAEICFRMGNLKKANEILDEFLQGGYLGTLANSDAFIGLGNMYCMEDIEHRFDKAIKCYEIAVKNAKNDSVMQMAMYYLASAYYENGDISDALKAYKKYLKKFPNGSFRNLSHKYIKLIEEREK